MTNDYYNRLVTPINENPPHKTIFKTIFSNLTLKSNWKEEKDGGGGGDRDRNITLKIIIVCGRKEA